MPSERMSRKDRDMPKLSTSSDDDSVISSLSSVSNSDEDRVILGHHEQFFLENLYGSYVDLMKSCVQVASEQVNSLTAIVASLVTPVELFQNIAMVDVASTVESQNDNNNEAEANKTEE